MCHLLVQLGIGLLAAFNYFSYIPTFIYNKRTYTNHIMFKRNNINNGMCTHSTCGKHTGHSSMLCTGISGKNNYHTMVHICDLIYVLSTYH
jgi:hypothetical protein